MENVMVQVFRVFVNDTLIFSYNFKLIYSLTSTFILFTFSRVCVHDNTDYKLILKCRVQYKQCLDNTVINKHVNNLVHFKRT